MMVKAKTSEIFPILKVLIFTVTPPIDDTLLYTNILNDYTPAACQEHTKQLRWKKYSIHC
jgi:hypothetical protein